MSLARCAIEGLNLGQPQLQTMLQRASVGMLSIDAENGTLLATVAAAIQSQITRRSMTVATTWRPCTLTALN